MPSNQPSSAGNGTVLVVDPDTDLRELAATWLRMTGFGVRTAADHRTALVLLDDTAVTCVLVDLAPGATAATVALLAAVRDRRPDCRTVVTSVLDAVDCPAADAVLPKPFGRARLVAAVLDPTAVPAPRGAADRDVVPAGGVLPR